MQYPGRYTGSPLGAKGARQGRIGVSAVQRLRQSAPIPVSEDSDRGETSSSRLRARLRTVPYRAVTWSACAASRDL